MINVSVRTSAGTGADTLMVGFSIAGAGNKQLLVRGVGPGLASFGVANAVADPELRLFNQANTEISRNDDWSDPAAVTAATAIGAFPLGVGSRDAAVLANLPAGPYSAHLISKSGNGVVLVEAYDADGATATAQLSNISARSVAGTGANTLTVGFSIAGDSNKTVLIRAVGPSLSIFGVTNTLSNPELRLFSSRNNLIGHNDDWPNSAGWGPAASSVGAFTLTNNSRDAMILVSLPPGAYTAQASGIGGTSGVALIEIYDVVNAPSASFVLQPVENTVLPVVTGSPADRAVNLPSVRTQARPQYPFALRVAGISGEALIQFVVGVDGRVAEAGVVRATDFRFGDAAMAAVLQWTFQPGRNAVGQPVPTLMQVPIVFTLNES